MNGSDKAIDEIGAWAPPRNPMLRIVLVVGSIVLVGLILVWAIWADSSPSWTGFGAYNEATKGSRAKTLWDWLGLLIIPAVLAGGALWFNKSQKETELKIAERARTAEREIAEGRQRQATLEAYYDRMTELLLEHGLRESDAESEVRSIARARTIATVKSLDSERNRQLFSFLAASSLLTSYTPAIDLRGADFSGIDLMGVNLAGARLDRSNFISAHLFAANLQQADLSGAFLVDANLRLAMLRNTMLMEANLSGADLQRANLSGAVLHMASLQEADLEGANLSMALLDGADLTRCNLVGADLSRAHLRRANLQGSKLTMANLRGADLSGTDLAVANLTSANLENARLTEADLSAASLASAKGWTIEQLEQASSLEGAIMPNGVRLQTDLREGPTFAEWKAQVIAHEGTTEA